eukprot:SAG31_NODE_2167_length_6269_cov_4.097731_8_plen_60_part_00
MSARPEVRLIKVGIKNTMITNYDSPVDTPPIRIEYTKANRLILLVEKSGEVARCLKAKV